MGNRLTTVLFFICLTFLWNNSCLAGIFSISGTVVDAENGEPVEGAVVVFEWSQAKGVIGMTHTDTYKIVETVTDKNGKFSVPRVLNPLVSAPYFVIYKKGYYCWRTEWDPMTDTKRNDFKLRSNLTYEMNRYIPGKYLHKHSTAPCFTGINEVTPSLDEAILWERKLVDKEVSLYHKKFVNLPPEVKAKTHVPPSLLADDYQKYREVKRVADEIRKGLWKEVLQELYLPSEESIGEQNL